MFLSKTSNYVFLTQSRSGLYSWKIGQNDRVRDCHEINARGKLTIFFSKVQRGDASVGSMRQFDVTATLFVPSFLRNRRLDLDDETHVGSGQVERRHLHVPAEDWMGWGQAAAGRVPTAEGVHAEPPRRQWRRVCNEVDWGGERARHWWRRDKVCGQEGHVGEGEWVECAIVFPRLLAAARGVADVRAVKLISLGCDAKTHPSLIMLDWGIYLLLRWLHFGSFSSRSM